MPPLFHPYSVLRSSQVKDNVFTNRAISKHEAIDPVQLTQPSGWFNLAFYWQNIFHIILQKE